MTHSPGQARRLTAVVAAFGIALVSTGCGSGATTSNSAAAQGNCDPKATGPGVTNSEILLGATMPLTGSGASGGIGVREGQQAFYDKLNKDGGIQGHQAKLNILDDAYDPSTAQRQMRQLVENDKILAVSGGEGTPNFLGVVPYLKRQGVPAIAPYAPSDTLGTKDVPNVFMATVDYVTEFEILTNYAIQQGAISKMALVGVAGNVGDNAQEGMKKAIGDKAIQLTYVPETPGTTDFTPIASQLKQSGAEWVFLILTNADTGGLLQAMSRIGYTPRTAAWAGMSDDSYITEFGELSQDMFVALETAALDSTDPKVKQFVSDFIAQTGHAPTKFNELGWVQAELTAEGLRQAKGLSRPCLMDALEGISGFETGILPPVTWGKDDRSGVDAVGIGQIKGQGLTVVEETRSLDK
jgi:ABC-type branched-subunit amino acid transport system substrate-binding protein